jgi:ATP-dependent DNA helicase RecG
MPKKQTKLIDAVSRIVIGDVGSGKTIVAHLIAYLYLSGVESGIVVLMAPTELLARQHYTNLLELLNNLDGADISAVYRAKTKTLVDNIPIKKLELKNKQIWIGTQALLHVKDLVPNLVLVDEQHRFGVKQRAKLAEHGAHYVSFTATPIPRTLAMTLFSDLQPVFLERISTRSPITTSIILLKDFENSIIDIIKEHITKQGKVYIVCPLVEDGEIESEYWTVKKMHTFISKYFDNVLYTHGAEKTKQDTLEEFRSNDDCKILIATTVIEVGLDVKDATLMIIANAERFGMSSLHQLRGRVGRNNRSDNECFLIAPFASQRLVTLVNEQDGYKIANQDMQMRGAGSLRTGAQSGIDIDKSVLLDLDSDTLVVLNNIVEKSLVDPSCDRLRRYVSKEINETWKE